jgi:two-component system, NtrC family, sensor kinase
MFKGLFILFIIFFCGSYTIAKNLDSLSREFVKVFDYPEKADSILHVLNEIKKQGFNEGDSNKIVFAIFHEGLINLALIKDYSTALDYFHQAFKKYKRLKNTSWANLTSLQIGLTHYKQKNFNEAISWFEIVKEGSESDSNTRRKATAVYLKGLCEIEINKLEEAEANLRTAIDLYNTIPYEQGFYEAMSGLGIMHIKKGNGDSALFYLTPTLNFFIIKNDPDALAWNYPLVSEAHLLKKNLDHAIMFAEKALEQGKKLNNKRREIKAYEALFNSYAAVGKYKEAYFYSNEYNKINNEIYNEENNNRILHLRTKFEKENLETNFAIEQARKEEINLAQLNKQKLFRNFFFVCFLLVLIIIVILFNRYKVKNSKNKKLADTLDKLNKTQTQLLHHEKLASLGRLMAGIAHEIQNPLNFVNNFSELSKDLISEYKNASDPAEKDEIMSELISNMEKINLHGKRADSIVRNMLQHGRKSDAIKKPTDINQLSTEFLNFAYYGYKAANKDIHIDIEKYLSPSIPELKIVQQDISRVFINLFNNSFDAIHHKAITNVNAYDPKIILETVLEANKVLIKIKDNGTGIPEDIKSKIFDPFFTTKPAGSGTGLGLSISNDIVLAHGGKIDISSEKDKFTEVVVELPVN